MKKHNGHSNSHATPPPHPVTPSYLPGALARPGAGNDRPLIGRALRHWETALAETRAKPAVHSTRSVQPGKAATSKSSVLSRILLQPNIVNAIAIDAAGIQGIGLQLREGGVMVQVDAWSPMQMGDLLELFWGAPDDPQSPGYPGSATVSKTLQFPEELNKPVLLAIPEDKVVAGWFNVVCRVTRANTGYQEMSPLLRVLVKLDRPGGIDPAPDENPNLAAPILPPEVIANGVDTEWAANGVPVTIQPYPNMAVGDRIRLNWGGVFVEYTLRDSSEVGQPVTLIVNEAAIRAAGDGDAVAVRYQIFDVVCNRSGWSPTVDVAVDVQGDALLLPQVTHADENGVIDLALLDGDDVRVIVTAIAPDFALGDVVTLRWYGRTAEGVLVPYEDAQPVTQEPIQTLEFFIPNASVVALAQGDAVVSYSLQTGRSSKQVRVTIVGDAVQLPAPTVDEAPNDYDELDASLSLATVRIAPYPGMDAGDVVLLIWSGTRADGVGHVYSASRQISGSAVGKEVTFAVPNAEFALLAGGTVALWYEVTIGDGTPLRPSQVRTLRVSDVQGIVLPAPSVDEAPDNATLDPDAVGLYADVRIAPYPGMAIDDRVDMYWIGSGADGSMNDWITIGAATLNKPLLFDVDKAYVTANEGGTVTVRYTVTPKGGSPRSSAALTLRVANQRLAAPAVKEADGSASLDPLNVVDRLTVVVPVYDGWLPSDQVSVTWMGTNTYTTMGQVLDSSREVALPVSLVASNLGKEVRLTYTVIRNGLPFDSSTPLNLSVLPISESALANSRPQILQASNTADGSGVLNLYAVAGGATIRIYNWPHIALGQPLWLRLHGKNATDGSDLSLTIWQPPGAKVSQDWLTQGYGEVAVPYSYLGQLMWGSTLSVEFKVGFDQSFDETDATTFPARTYVVDDWKDSITTFDDGTVGSWLRGPAYTQGIVVSGVFRNPTTALSGHAGVVLKQTFTFLAGRVYRFRFKIRAYVTTSALKPNFSVDSPVHGQIIPASDVPLDQKWYTREGYFSVPVSGSLELSLVSHQDRGGGSGADGGNDYELDDITVTLASEGWKDSITTFGDGTRGSWQAGPAITQGAIKDGLFRNPTTSQTGHAGVVMKQSFFLLAGEIYRFSFRMRSALVSSVGLKPNFSAKGPVLGEIVPPMDIPLDGKWYLREGYFSVPADDSYEIDLVSHQDRGGGSGADGGNDYDLDYIALTLAAELPQAGMSSRSRRRKKLEPSSR